MKNSQFVYNQAAEFVLINSKGIENIGKALAIGLAISYTAWKFYDAYFGILSGLPGPFLGRFIEFRGYLDLHAEYGLVVRLDPQYIAVSYKEMIKQILVKDDLMKGSNYTKVPDLWSLFQCQAFDIIGETSFGETFNMLERNNHPVPIGIGKTLKVVQLVMMDTFLGWLIQHVLIPGAGKSREQLYELMTRIVRERMDGGEAARRSDILQVLIDMQKKENPEERLSQYQSFAVIELLRHPEVLAKLRQEIDAFPMENGVLFKHDQLKHLPYLNAVINETLGIDAIAASGLVRMASEDIILGKGVFVPKGTIINANIYSLHMNGAYKKSPQEFRPERWLEDADSAPDMDAYYPFSAGTRNCIAKNFALQEMRLTLATLLRLYDLKPIPEGMKDVEDTRQYYFTL
ncbi:hypothetical protein VTP01DRAFT_4866 [Rhizomucor pusillus]|uniref:uncharacterized protein n=1 Tax=Rhizomucor pusillus TaxID=4840 RepID=UPI003742B55B